MLVKFSLKFSPFFFFLAEPGPLVQLGCGTISGALGATFVYPLQVIRTRYDYISESLIWLSFFFLNYLLFIVMFIFILFFEKENSVILVCFFLVSL